MFPFRCLTARRCGREVGDEGVSCEETGARQGGGGGGQEEGGGVKGSRERGQGRRVEEIHQHHGDRDPGKCHCLQDKLGNNKVKKRPQWSLFQC